MKLFENFVTFFYRHQWNFIETIEKSTSALGQFFMSNRYYDSTQTNHRKNLSSLLIRKSNLNIINILGREILKSGSGRKTLSKTHQPEIGVAARWKLIWLIEKYIYFWKTFILKLNYDNKNDTFQGRDTDFLPYNWVLLSGFRLFFLFATHWLVIKENWAKYNQKYNMI